MRKEGIPKSCRFDPEFRFCEPSPEAVVRICSFVFPTFNNFPFALKISKSMVIRIYLFSNIAEFAPGWKVIDTILTQFAILSKPIIPGKDLAHSI